MATQITMPKLGLTMQEGTIKEWKKKEGDEVKKGEILYVLETEKVTFDVEAPESGILGKIIAQVNDTVPVGGLVAYMLQPGEKLSDIPQVPSGAEVKVEAKMPAEPVAGGAEKIAIPKEVRISPLARRIAEENNVDVSTIQGSGPDGRIAKEDVLRAIEERKTVTAKPPVTKAPEAVGPGDKIIPLSTLRKTIARRMVESFQSSPHFYITIEVDTKELEALRQKLIPFVEQKAGVRLTFTDLLVKIVAKALEEHPFVNASFIGNAIKLFGQVNVGLATSVEEGLIVPVIRGANKLSLMEIAKVRAELVTKVRERKASLEEITGSTFTITNIGMFGIITGGAIINPPESGILLVGSTVEKPVVRDGQIVIRPMMNLTLSIDHRVFDGVAGARFLQRVKELIENPAFLIL